ncbi:hypothetical protein [Polynucleobacter sp.]|uniref:hypothetical protein n=1 Tax=Polynucleobacter sp. TaxID=2029855 RepID=UPI003F69F81C
MNNFVAESGLRGEIAWQDREDREEIARIQLQEQYSSEWLEAVTNEPLDSLVTFDSRTDWQATGTNYKNRIMRESTVAELFNDQYDYKDFSTRIAKIVIDAHKSGNKDATKLLGEMAVSFGEGKV